MPCAVSVAAVSLRCAWPGPPRNSAPHSTTSASARLLREPVPVGQRIGRPLRVDRRVAVAGADDAGVVGRTRPPVRRPVGVDQRDVPAIAGQPQRAPRAEHPRAHHHDRSCPMRPRRVMPAPVPPPPVQPRQQRVEQAPGSPSQTASDAAFGGASGCERPCVDPLLQRLAHALGLHRPDDQRPGHETREHEEQQRVASQGDERLAGARATPATRGRRRALMQHAQPHGRGAAGEQRVRTGPQRLVDRHERTPPEPERDRGHDAGDRQPGALADAGRADAHPEHLRPRRTASCPRRAACSSNPSGSQVCLPEMRAAARRGRARRPGCLPA